MNCFIKYFFPLVYVVHQHFVEDKYLVLETTQLNSNQSVNLNFGQKFFLLLIGILNIFLWILISPIILIIIFSIYLSLIIINNSLYPLIAFFSPLMLFSNFCLTFPCSYYYRHPSLYISTSIVKLS